METRNLASDRLLIIKSHKTYICAIAFFLGNVGEVSETCAVRRLNSRCFYFTFISFSLALILRKCYDIPLFCHISFVIINEAIVALALIGFIAWTHQQIN